MNDDLSRRQAHTYDVYSRGLTETDKNIVKIYTVLYTVPSTIIGTLSEYEQNRL